jgi:hypothetical protein
MQQTQSFPEKKVPASTQTRRCRTGRTRCRLDAAGSSAASTNRPADAAGRSAASMNSDAACVRTIGAAIPTLPRASHRHRTRRTDEPRDPGAPSSGEAKPERRRLLFLPVAPAPSSSPCVPARSWLSRAIFLAVDTRDVVLTLRARAVVLAVRARAALPPPPSTVRRSNPVAASARQAGAQGSHRRQAQQRLAKADCDSQIR